MTDKIETYTPEKLGKGALWTADGFPRRDWTVVDWYDLGEGVTQLCSACACRAIRYINVLTHPAWEGVVEVGCVCAGHLMRDHKAAEAYERKNINRVKREAAARKKEEEREKRIANTRLTFEALRQSQRLFRLQSALKTGRLVR